MNIQEDISRACADTLKFSDDDKRHAVIALTMWLKGRSRVPDSDPRLKETLAQLPVLIDHVQAVLHEEKGIALITENRTGVLLERGATWFSGGDWRSVVLGAVIKA